MPSLAFFNFADPGHLSLSSCHIRSSQANVSSISITKSFDALQCTVDTAPNTFNNYTMTYILGFDYFLYLN